MNAQQTRARLLGLLTIAILISLVASACAPVATPAVVRETVEVEKIVVATPTPRPPVTVRFQHWGPPEEQQLYEQWAAKFHDQFPWITVQVEAVPVSEYFAKLLPNVAAGTSPDVVRAHTLAQVGIFTKLFIPLDEFMADPAYGLDKRDYVDSTWFYCEDEGKTYCLPTDFIAFSLYYNKKLFDDAGIPYPTNDWDWPKFVEVANQLTQDVDGDGIMDVCGFFADPNYLDPWYMWLLSAGGSVVSEDHKQAVFNQAGGYDALKLYIDTVKCWQVGSAAPGAGGVEFSFRSGNVAMFVSGPWERPGLDAMEDRTWDYGVARLPKHPDHPRANIAAGGTVGVSPNSKHPFEAYLWARSFVLYDAQYFFGKLGWAFPTNKAALLDVLPLREDNQPFWEDAQNNQIMKLYFSKYNAIAPVMRSMLQEALLKGSEPDFDIQATLDRYAEEATAILQEE